MFQNATYLEVMALWKLRKHIIQHNSAEFWSTHFVTCTFQFMQFLTFFMWWYQGDFRLVAVPGPCLPNKPLHAMGQLWLSSDLWKSQKPFTTPEGFVVSLSWADISNCQNKALIQIITKSPYKRYTHIGWPYGFMFCFSFVYSMFLYSNKSSRGRFGSRISFSSKPMPSAFPRPSAPWPWATSASTGWTSTGQGVATRGLKAPNMLRRKKMDWRWLNMHFFYDFIMWVPSFFFLGQIATCTVYTYMHIHDYRCWSEHNICRNVMQNACIHDMYVCVCAPGYSGADVDLLRWAFAFYLLQTLRQSEAFSCDWLSLWVVATMPLLFFLNPGFQWISINISILQNCCGLWMM